MLGSKTTQLKTRRKRQTQRRLTYVSYKTWTSSFILSLFNLLIHELWDLPELGAVSPTGLGLI